MKTAFLLAFCFLTASAAHAAQVGDDFAGWLKDPQFKAKYATLIDKTPIKGAGSWAYKDAKLAPSSAFAGLNANTWVQLSTCAVPKTACRANHIDVFYDPKNQQMFAYLTLGNHVGWIGKPMSSEQKFFSPYLTAKTIPR